MKKIFSYAKKYKKYIFTAMFFIVLDVSIELATPQFVKQIINNIGAGNISSTVKIGIMMIVFAGLGIVAGVFNAKYSSAAGVGFTSDLREGVFKKVQEFSFKNIDSFSTASLSTRLTNDMTMIQSISIMGLRMIVKSPLMLIFSVIMAIKTGGSLALIIAVTFPILLIGLFIILRKAMSLFANMQKKIDVVNRNIQENVTNVRVVKSFVREDYEKKKFKVSNDSLMKASLAAMNRVIFNMPLMMFVMNVSIISIVYFGGNRVIAGTLDVASMTTVINYVFHILMSLMMLSMTFVMISRSTASFKRVAEVLDTEVDLKNNSGANNELEINGNVKFDHVDFKYDIKNNENVLTDISFEANRGQMIAILGGTGSGKTSLVQLIARLYDITGGSISFDGHNITEFTLDDLRNQIGIVLQKNTLFSGTIKDNLRWGNEDATDEELEQACKNAQAHEFIMSFPKGYDTWIDQGGVNVSGGQKQRLCIARTLLKKPKILILDDSTSAVDTATEANIRKAFRTQLKDTTVILIAQRISSVMSADKIIVMDDGRIVAQGTHDELMQSSVEYQEIYYSQVDKEANA